MARDIPNASTWRLDEASHAGPEHTDPACVAGYDAKAATDPAADVARALDASGAGGPRAPGTDGD